MWHRHHLALLLAMSSICRDAFAAPQQVPMSMEETDPALDALRMSSHPEVSVPFLKIVPHVTEPV